jgi:CDP-paratose 2-epimerase
MTYNWQHLAEIPRVKCVKADILAPGSLDEIRDCDAVIHTAAQTAVTTSLADPIMDMKINLIGTLSVLEATRKAGTDPCLVFCSTNKVYGDNVNRLPVTESQNSYHYAANRKGIDEDFPIDKTGHTPYGSSKLAADTYVQDYAHTYGLKSIVFRMSCIYGPRQFGVEDQGWVAWFAIASVLGRPVTVYGDGKQLRDVLYVDDLVRAFELALE